MCGSLSLMLSLSLRVFCNGRLLGVTCQNKYFKVEVCSVHGVTETHEETINFVFTNWEVSENEQVRVAQLCIN